MNARRCRSTYVIYEENEEYRGDDRVLEYTSIDGMQIREEAVHSDKNPLSGRKVPIHLMTV